MAIDLATITGGDGSLGFVLQGEQAYDRAGTSVASAGDVNGDGFDDVIVGARTADGPADGRGAAGDSYVIFGTAGGFGATLDLASITAGDGSLGFVLQGEQAYDLSGISVASAGDVNGDGFDDVIVGALNADGPLDGRSQAGDSYVIFGTAGGFGATLDLASIATGDGSLGFVLQGERADDRSGFSVAPAGDVNGDGFADVIVGAFGADGPADGRSLAGDSYVIFGKAGGFGAALDLASITAGDGSLGFVLQGEQALDQSGISVASAGDVNGDGFADLIVGARDADGPANGRTSAGDSYVIFGKAAGFGATLDLASITAGDGSLGFVLQGEGVQDLSGWSVASAGDVNGDGFDDLIVGALYADGPADGRSSAGDSYVIFGKAAGFGATIDLATVAAGTGGFVIHGERAADRSGVSVASAGDVNGDGFDDLIVGAPYADGPADGREAAGDSYVIFGSATIGGSADEVTHPGTAGADTLAGDGTANVMVGGLGDDVLEGNGGADVFHAGAGDDEITVADLSFRRADGGSGSDTLALAGAGLTLDLTDRLLAARLQGIERIDLAGTGDNTLTIDRLAVLTGIGAVSGNRRVLTVFGDAGDTVQLDDRQWRKTGSFSNADGDFDRYSFGRAIVDIEQSLDIPGATIDGTAGNDTVKFPVTVGGQPLPTRRDDIINGLGGDDILDGGFGADTMAGGTDDDLYFVDNAGDVVTELADEGTDTVRSTVSHALAANVENLTLKGGDAIDGTGNGLANVLTGNAAANVLAGGDGDDTYAVGAGDTVIENDDEGTDTVRSKISHALASNVENLILKGAAAIDGTGNELANVLTGNNAANVLSGGDGNDTYVVGAGDTTIENDGEGSDTVLSSVDHTLAANVENLTLTGSALAGTGNALANVLTGNGKANVLSGGDGNDRLVGGAGSDTLTGGNDADTFVFAAPSSGIDTIADFLPGTDLIEVSAAGFGSGLVAGFPPTVVNAPRTAAATSAGTDGYFIFDTAGPNLGTLYWDATGGNGADAVAVARLPGVASLAASDFQVV
ncbi:MAG: FG-GAP repeat protein [Enhydrobacter sp.]|nr:FG-GAP repeat protein [Enhydrobacter sp.]